MPICVLHRNPSRNPRSIKDFMQICLDDIFTLVFLPFLAVQRLTGGERGSVAALT